MEPSNQELKELLLQYNISDNDIKGHGKNGIVLKSDRLKVYKKIIKPKIAINNKMYTEDELIMMINFYVNYHLQNVNNAHLNAQQMNKDTWLNVLLQSDMNSLKISCSLNKTTNNLCHSDYFWEMKFKYDGLPLIMDKYPIMINGWINEYTKISNAYHIVNKFVNYILTNRREDFYIISFDEETYDMNNIKWLTPKINEEISKSIDNADLSLYFNVKNLTITFSYLHINEDGDYSEDMTYIKDIVSKEDFIIYLTKMFYHFPKMAILNDTDIGFEDIYLTYNDLLNDRHMKKILSGW